MSKTASAAHGDPSLYCAFFGGPRDGLKSGDLPATLSGAKLTGMVMRMPLSQPHQFSLHAVYECTSETQIDGFWRFEFRGLEGPNGETLVAAETEPAKPVRPLAPELRALFVRRLELPASEAAVLTDEEVRARVAAAFVPHAPAGRVLDDADLWAHVLGGA